MPLGVIRLSVHLARCPLGVVPVKFPVRSTPFVEVISSFDAFGPRVRELAARHVGYGTADPAHRALAEALLGALGAHRTAVWPRAAGNPLR
jgi:hypothetical protein